MKLPKSLKIGHLTYSIHLVDTLANDNGQALYGQQVPSNQELKFLKGMTREREKEIVLHEVLHALFDEYYPAQCDDEEKIVTALAIGLATVLKDNPNFKKYLMK